MARTAQALDTVTTKIEQATWLDPIADAAAKIVKRVLPRGVVRDTASGTPLGHPLHPALVAVPVGSWSAALYLDLLGGRRHRRAARRLVGLGNLAAIPTALTGANDWADTKGGERRIGLVHALLNDVAPLRVGPVVGSGERSRNRREIAQPDKAPGRPAVALAAEQVQVESRRP